MQRIIGVRASQGLADPFTCSQLIPLKKACAADQSPCVPSLAFDATSAGFSSTLAAGALNPLLSAASASIG